MFPFLLTTVPVCCFAAKRPSGPCSPGSQHLLSLKPDRLSRQQDQSRRLHQDIPGLLPRERANGRMGRQEPPLRLLFLPVVFRPPQRVGQGRPPDVSEAILPNPVSIVSCGQKKNQTDIHQGHTMTCLASWRNFLLFPRARACAKSKSPRWQRFRPSVITLRDVLQICKLSRIRGRRLTRLPETLARQRKYLSQRSTMLIHWSPETKSPTGKWNPPAT